jgi:hypothetical protein
LNSSFSANDKLNALVNFKSCRELLPF